MLFKKTEPLKEKEPPLVGERTVHTMTATDVITGKESTETVKTSWRLLKE